MWFLLFSFCSFDFGINRILTHVGFCQRTPTIEKFLYHGLVSNDVVTCFVETRYFGSKVWKKLFKVPNVSQICKDSYPLLNANLDSLTKSQTGLLQRLNPLALWGKRQEIKYSCSRGVLLFNANLFQFSFVFTMHVLTLF